MSRRGRAPRARAKSSGFGLWIGALALAVVGAALLFAPSGPPTPAPISSERPTGSIADCAPRDTLCLVNAWGDAVDRDGVPATVRAFGDWMRSATASDNCHVIAHAIGAAAYDAMGGEAIPAIAAGTIECGGGYVHAVLMRTMVEAAAVDAPTSISAALPICRDPAISADHALLLECLHGLGHGVIGRTQSVPDSIAGCDAMPEATDEEITLCLDGVIMEAFDPNESGRASLRTPGDPLAVCETFATAAHRSRCAHYAVRSLSDLPAVLAACATIDGDAPMREECLAGGISNLWSSAATDPAGAAAACAAAAERATCEWHLASAIGFVSTRLAPEVDSFCRLTVDAPTCYGAAAAQLAGLQGEDAALAACAALALPFDAADGCRRGARGE